MRHAPLSKWRQNFKDASTPAKMNGCRCLVTGACVRRSRQARPFGKADGFRRSFRPPASQTSLKSALSFLHAPRPLICPVQKREALLVSAPARNAPQAAPPPPDSHSFKTEEHKLAQIGNFPSASPPRHLLVCANQPVEVREGERHLNPTRKGRAPQSIFPTTHLIFFCDRQKTLRWGTN